MAEEGIDEAIQEVLGLKVSQFVGIMGDKEETEEDRALSQQKATEHMARVIEKLKKIKLKEEESARDLLFTKGSKIIKTEIAREEASA